MDRMQITSFPGLEGEYGEGLLIYTVFFKGYEKILNVDSGHSCGTVDIKPSSYTFFFKRVSFMV